MELELIIQHWPGHYPHLEWPAGVVSVAHRRDEGAGHKGREEEGKRDRREKRVWRSEGKKREGALWV